jgi:hypothetical protein
VSATIFGRIVSGADVEDWCEQLIRRWISTYLAEKERQDGLKAGALPRPRGWVVAPDVNKWPEDQLPTILLASTGVPAIPQKGGDGRYRARFDMRVTSIVSASTERDSRRLAHRYTAALRALFTHRPSLDGHANGVDWVAEDYAVLAYDDQRTLGVSTVALFVQVDDVTTAGAGPATPDEPLDPDIQPWPDWPLVTEVDVDVVGAAITKEEA